jgi:hypothetical protein
MKTSIKILAAFLLFFIINNSIANPTSKSSSKSIKQIYMRKEPNNQFRLHLLKESDVRLKTVITDSHGTIIFKETLQNGDTLLKKYDLSTLNKGNYIIQLFEGKEIIAAERFVID